MKLLTTLLLAYIFTINLYADKEYYDRIGSKPLTCTEQTELRLQFSNTVRFYKPRTSEYNKLTRKYERIPEPRLYIINNRIIPFKWKYKRVSLYPNIITPIYWSHVVNNVMNCKYKITTFQQRGHTVYIISDKD